MKRAFFSRWTVVAAALLFLATTLVGGTRALAYYGSSFTYYLKDPNNNAKAYVTASGYWTGWSGNWFLATSARIDVNIMSSAYELNCIFIDVDIALSIPYSENVQLRYSNTPFYRSVPWGTGSTGGDALYEVSTSKDGPPAGCNYYSVSNDAYNSFVVPHGTNYNNQYDAHDITSYP